MCRKCNNDSSPKTNSGKLDVLRGCSTLYPTFARISNNGIWIATLSSFFYPYPYLNTALTAPIMGQICLVNKIFFQIYK